MLLKQAGGLFQPVQRRVDLRALLPPVLRVVEGVLPFWVAPGELALQQRS